MAKLERNMHCINILFIFFNMSDSAQSPEKKNKQKIHFKMTIHN